MSDSTKSNLNTAFWLHLLITALAWVGPFLFSWYYLLPCYAIVLLQFAVFGKCLVNQVHNLGEENDMTFYAEIFEAMGFNINRSRLKFYVRKVYYPVLSVFTLIWQLGLGFKPLLF